MTDPACIPFRFQRIAIVCMSALFSLFLGGADGGCDPFPVPVEPNESCESDSDCGDDSYCDLVTVCTDCAEAEDSDAIPTGLKKKRKLSLDEYNDAQSDPSEPATDLTDTGPRPDADCEEGCVTTGTCQPIEPNNGCYSDDECPAGTQCNAAEVCLPPPGCEPGDICDAVCYGECVPASCDDAPVPACDMLPPTCTDGTIPAVQNGCYECVDPETCEPPSDECQIDECGPELGMPSYQCADGTIGGNTGRCIRGDDNQCGWEIIDCEPCQEEDCEPTLTCANVDCLPGYTCEMVYPPCAADSEDCDPVPVCVPQNNGQCDDDSTQICEMVPPTCDDGLILAVQNDCYECVDPHTCEPPPPPLTCANVLCAQGTHCVMQDVDCIQSPCPAVPVCIEDEEEGCYSDADCSDGTFCNAADICLHPPGCGEGDPCPAVCYGFCVEEKSCDDDSEVICDMLPPHCDDGLVLAVQNGCYECVEAETCEPPPPPLTCETVLCMEGYHCEMQDVVCVQSPCPPVPVCVEDESTCDDDIGLLCDMDPPPVCEDGLIRAIRNGCYECVEAETCQPPPPPLTCENVLCPEGSHCEMQDVQCIQAPCPPLPICVEDQQGCYGDGDCSDGYKCNADEICLPPPGCDDDSICEAVCYGFCVEQDSSGEPTDPTD
jgi:hypothetical protein